MHFLILERHVGTNNLFQHENHEMCLTQKHGQNVCFFEFVFLNVHVYFLQYASRPNAFVAEHLFSFFVLARFDLIRFQHEWFDEFLSIHLFHSSLWSCHLLKKFVTMTCWKWNHCWLQQIWQRDSLRHCWKKLNTMLQRNIWIQWQEMHDCRCFSFLLVAGTTCLNWIWSKRHLMHRLHSVQMLAVLIQLVQLVQLVSSFHSIH